MTSRYGISDYPDVPAVQAQLARLTSTPVRTLTKEQLEEYHAWYAEHTPASRAAAAEAEAVIPGGVQHNLALNDPWPLDIVAANGAYLHDADGNQYVDFLLRTTRTATSTTTPTRLSCGITGATAPSTRS